MSSSAKNTALSTAFTVATYASLPVGVAADAGDVIAGLLGGGQLFV